MENNTFICKKCKIEKDFNQFYKSATNKNGIVHSCISCSKEQAYKRIRNVNGLILQIYRVQKRTSKRRKHDNPHYTQQELKEWIISQPNFNTLYNEWVASGYETNKKPSIDRLNDYIPYTIQNIRLTTWEVNNEKARNDRRNGINNKINISVTQYDSDMNVLNIFHSIRHASRATGVNRWNMMVACETKKRAGGFYWEKNKK